MMSPDKFTHTCMLLLLPIYLFAQGRVTGKVTDGNIPLAGVNITILTTDINYITNAQTDSLGIYTFQHKNYDSVLLHFSLMGYANKMYSVKTSTSLQTIILTPTSFTMDAITITGKRSPYNIKPGITTVDLSAASTGSDGTLLNTLGKIPGVLILNNGTILLNGQTGANVMINGKPTYLTGENLVNLLRSIPANSVDKIDLVSHPSAAYDAAGTSGFINIQQKQKTKNGLQLNIASNIEAGIYTRQNQSFSARFQHKHFTIYSDYSFYKGTDFMLVSSSRQYAKTDLNLNMQAQRKFANSSQYFKSGIDYQCSDRLSINTYLSTNWFKRNKNELAISDFYHGLPASDSTLHTVNQQHTQQTNLSAGANFAYKFNSKIKWENTFNILHFLQDDQSDQNSKMNHGNTDVLKGIMTNNINIYTFQSDMYIIVSDDLTIQSGIKTTAINIKSNAQYNSPQSGQDEKLSSSFHYQENVYAGYMQTDKKWTPRFSTAAGLRFEYTNTASPTLFRRSYAQLFPTLSAEYQINDDQVLACLYSRRIARPNYRDLNPFTEVNDRYLQEKGNTRLQPTLINNMELSWLLRSQYVFSILYTIQDNPITKSYLTETGSQTTIVMPLNLGRSHAISIKAGMNNLKPTTWWTTHLNVSLAYRTFYWSEFNTPYNNYLFTPTAQVSNQFTLSHQWMIEATGYFNGKMAEGQAIIGEMGALSLGLRKNLLENKLSIYLYANDIFLTTGQHIQLNNSVLSGAYRERRDSRMAGITLSWHLNAGNLTKITDKKSNWEESKRMN
ncbi:TonB-dependent receptor [[Flexibacter] sp. ATCC 35208]|uniref:TonB-dependent receptor domain-containing protein n=1 Tax=[Flexibacter] sp. ATCC 35208 TaxID=1936242 RepID=UPI0009C60CD4|nr:TonB-dependent receptor [[Flexibacter] sp. ATCC 35208]OMP76768.1 hypothetical protein BW716_23535 [[Flexibacter] sp. ATCC 35208]